MSQCEGHDTKKKAHTQCPGCKKNLCNSCLEIHLSIFDECKLESTVQTKSLGDKKC